MSHKLTKLDGFCSDISRYATNELLHNDDLGKLALACEGGRDRIQEEILKCVEKILKDEEEEESVEAHQIRLELQGIKNQMLQQFNDVRCELNHLHAVREAIQENVSNSKTDDKRQSLYSASPGVQSDDSKGRRRKRRGFEPTHLDTSKHGLPSDLDKLDLSNMEAFVKTEDGKEITILQAKDPNDSNAYKAQVKSKIISGDYVLVDEYRFVDRRPGAWNFFKCVLDAEGQPVNGFVACPTCYAVFYQPADHSKASLARHKCYRDANGNDEGNIDESDTKEIKEEQDSFES